MRHPGIHLSCADEISKDDILTIENVLNQCGTAGGNDRKTWLRNLKNINMGPAEADHFLGDRKLISNLTASER